MEGHWKYLGGGVLKAKILEAKYEAKLEFLGGRWGCKTKNLPWGSMDIFWNCAICMCMQMCMYVPLLARGTIGYISRYKATIRYITVCDKTSYQQLTLLLGNVFP